MKLYQVTAIDSDGCDTAVNAQLTRKEAREVVRDWLTDAGLQRAGAVRVVTCEDETGIVVDDVPMVDMLGAA